MKYAPVPWRTFQAATPPRPRDDHGEKKPPGREIKYERYERSREFLSDESKLE